MAELLRSWAVALADSDNPLTQYYVLSERRRRAAVPVLRRHGLLLGTLLLGFALATLIIVEDGGRTIKLDVWPAVFYMLIAVPVCFVWFMQGLYNAALGASGLLGLAGRRLHLVVDDMLALSTLSDRQIVAGALRILLPPLIARAVGAALLVWSIVALETLEFGAGQADERTVLALTTAPFTIGGMALVSSLALTLLVLWWIAHGRGLPAAPLISAHVMLQMPLLPFWLAVSLFLIAVEHGFFGEELNPQGYFWFPLLAGLGLTLGHAAVLKLGLHSSAVRAVLLVGGPALAPVVMVLALSSLSDAFFWELPQLLLAVLLWLLSAVQPLSLSAVPLAQGMVVPHPDGLQAEISLSTPYYFALLLILQLGLLLLTLRAAEASVGLHRRSA